MTVPPIGLRGVDVAALNRMRIGGISGAGAAPGAPDATGAPGASAGGERIQLPTNIAPPLGSMPWLASGAVDTGAVNEQIRVAQFQTPAGEIPVLYAAAFLLGDAAPGFDLYFQLRVNGAPMMNWDRVRPFPTGGVWSAAFDLRHRLPDGALVEAWVFNVAGTSHAAGATLQGWHFPIATD